MKKVMTILIVFALATATASAATMISRYSFNETSGTTVSDSVSGLNGSLQGAAVFDGAGSAVLDGTGGTYVDLDPASLSGLGAVTLDAWFTYSVPNDNVHLFSIDNGSGTGSGGSYLRLNAYDSRETGPFIESIVSWTGNKTVAPSHLAQDAEVHVTVVYDGVNHYEALYVDGVLAFELAGDASSVPALSGIPLNVFTLGRSPWASYGDPMLVGSINEFRVFDGALTAGDIQAYDIMGPDAIPDPYPGQTGVDITKVLSWPVPSDPNFDPGYTMTYDIYVDPNATIAASGIGCSYSSTGQTGTTFDPTPNLNHETSYYWKVDSHVKYDYRTEPNVLSGPVWAFTTAPLDMTPVVDAGSSIITTLELTSSPNVLTLNGSVTDDGTSPLTVGWEAYDVAFGGGLTTKVTFADATAPATTVTISEVGTYILKLSATDATGTVTDQIEIIVYDSDCDAAKATGTHVANYYDRDDNCVVDLSDFAVFAAEWLDSTALTASYLYSATVTAPTDNALVAEYWTGISGTDPNSLLEDARYPASPDGSYLVVGELSGSMSGDNYGQRIRGYIVPETSGTYTFYIASDDGSRLFLSADSTPVDTDPALGNQIAEVPNGGYTGTNEWNKYPEQASGPVTLTAGQYYYVEVLHKEGTGGDHVLVGWSTDGGTTIEVIPGTVLRYVMP